MSRVDRQECADFAGISVEYLRLLAQGHKTPGAIVTRRLAAYFNVPADELLRKQTAAA